MAERILTDVTGAHLHVGDTVRYVDGRSERSYQVTVVDQELSRVYLDDDIAAIPATLRRVAEAVEDIDSAPPFPLPDLSNVLRFYPHPHRTANRAKPWRRTGGVA